MIYMDAFLKILKCRKRGETTKVSIRISGNVIGQYEYDTKIVPVYSMESHGVCGGVAPLFLNFGFR
jgi:hypothetical protein